LGNYTKYALSSFIDLIAPVVMKVHAEGGRLLPSVRVAQSWLETGGSVPYWYNLGGYKVGSARSTPWWDGSSVNTATKEVYNGVVVNTSANWRAYKSIYNYFKDQDLLFDNARYARVKAAKNYEEQCDALYACGYATDPQYASKLKSIIKSNQLTVFDIHEQELNEMEELKQQITELKKQVLDLQGKLELVDPPKWFVSEFGQAFIDRVISNPKMTDEGWRAVAITIRATKK